MTQHATNKKILITGAAGFIGSHLVEHILKNTDWKIVILDRLDTSGNPNRLVDMDCWETEKNRVKFFFWDLQSVPNDQILGQLVRAFATEADVIDGFAGLRLFDYIVHMAAGSHVDRSITDPVGFFKDNCMGTVNLLECLRQFKDTFLSPTGRFIYFSTDEVFGPAPEGVNFKEWDRFNPNNPYAAAKAAAEVACDAFANTYQLPISVIHCMNVYGERQHPEKFIPLCIKKVLNGETVTIHANKDKTKAGTRFYLHARNISDAVLFVLQNGKTLNAFTQEGKYNVCGDKEVSNLEMAQTIAGILGKELKYDMVDFHSSRPGHDLRYALDGSYIKEQGWVAPLSFEESLKKTIEWTIKNADKWLVE